MPTRLLSIFLLLLLFGASVGCGSSTEEDPKPLQELSGRWDEKSYVTTIYNEKGGVENTSTATGVDNYYVFKSDKTFEYHSGISTVIPGTYSYTNTTINLNHQGGTFYNFQDISVFTPSQLVISAGKQQAGTRSTVVVLTLVKH
ncbi:lipocalin family protein [Hymenobacter wooponensis]|uniref:Lipocalin-like domain-containing protein n=1 Tax=Hymenobacter wooponensis TaxID=1525360 RepID=A0A4Z0ML12_9BACT|nr:lipocalin family protein [Hymenobacter wooponensis]TGD80304.1 hypothetical protein EU557_10695 [Hymenobacter wooponensis]